MNNTKAPCYNCANRSVTPEHNCHSDCESYQAYRAKNEAQRAFLRDQRAKLSMVTETIINNTNRMKRRKPIGEHGSYRKGK